MKADMRSFTAAWIQRTTPNASSVLSHVALWRDIAHYQPCIGARAPFGAHSIRHALPLCSAGSTAVDGATDSAAQEDQKTIQRTRVGKRKVALFVGYEGTGYRGLQAQRSAPGVTIEDSLEAAIFAAGGILPSNMGSLNKLRWTRSSRTDKSVHSLATVVAMKMECDASSFEEDPLGLGLADAINAHLPATVRVFSVQRVTKKFNARAECTRRTYTYYLPANLLGVKGDGSKTDCKVLGLLHAAWKSFQGNHAFHNYTKRRLYREPRVKAGGPFWGNRREEALGEKEDQVDLTAAADTVEEPNEAVEDVMMDAEEQEFDEDIHNELSPGELDPSSAVSRRGGMRLEWRAERQESDPITRRHFRFVEECAMGDELICLSPGGDPCIRLSVRGASFMLHQIRHMVGAAVGVALQKIPLELLQASLAAPARMSMPLAPPCSLVLTDAEFSPFRGSWDGTASAVTQLTGDRLALRGGGVIRQQEFSSTTLLPAVDELLGTEVWGEWAADLERIWYDEDQLAMVLDGYTQWELRKEERRKARLAPSEMRE